MFHTKKLPFGNLRIGILRLQHRCFAVNFGESLRHHFCVSPKASTNVMLEKGYLNYPLVFSKSNYSETFGNFIAKQPGRSPFYVHFQAFIGVFHKVV